MPFLPQEMDFLMYGLIILFNFSASLRGVVNCTEFPRVKVTLNSYRYGSPAPGPLKGWASASSSQPIHATWPTPPGAPAAATVTAAGSPRPF